MNISTRKKLNYLFIAIITFLVFYVCIKYLLPIFLPFLLGYILSRIILPGVHFLNKKLNFHTTTANVIMILLLISSLILISYFLLSKLTTQLSDFIKNWDNVELVADNIARNCCNALENATGISGTTLYNNISEQTENAISMVQDNVFPKIMDYSIATIKGVANFIIFILITFISLFLFSKDDVLIQDYLNRCLFKNEIKFVRRIVRQVVSAYVKSQLIIMSLISLLCIIAFSILKSPYSVLYGIVVGILDIFPLIGAGTILVPIAIYYCLVGKYMYSVILFILFIVCYLLREILEPRLMGTRIGIHPLVSLISVFVGYKIFGLLGMLIGPFGYVFISEVLKYFGHSDNNGEI